METGNNESPQELAQDSPEQEAAAPDSPSSVEPGAASRHDVFDDESQDDSQHAPPKRLKRSDAQDPSPDEDQSTNPQPPSKAEPSSVPDLLQEASKAPLRRSARRNQPSRVRAATAATDAHQIASATSSATERENSQQRLPVSHSDDTRGQQTRSRGRVAAVETHEATATSSSVMATRSTRSRGAPVAAQPPDAVKVKVENFLSGQDDATDATRLPVSSKKKLKREKGLAGHQGESSLSTTFKKEFTPDSVPVHEAAGVFFPKLEEEDSPLVLIEAVAPSSSSTSCSAPSNPSIKKSTPSPGQISSKGTRSRSGTHPTSRSAGSNVSDQASAKTRANRQTRYATKANSDHLQNSNDLNLGLARRQDINKKLTDDRVEAVLSVMYKDATLTLSENRLTVTGGKGWSTILATRAASRGQWYFETKVELPETNENHRFTGWPGMLTIEPHIRVGWASRYSRFDLPIGVDAFGYCIRDVDGTVVNRARRKDYGCMKFGPGDVVGCFLYLPPPTFHPESPTDKPDLQKFLKDGLLCNPAKQPEAIPSRGSKIEFSINGTRLGCAFKKISTATYHPAVSLSMGAKVTVNFGPKFKYLREGSTYLPASEMHEPPLCPSSIDCCEK
eukprot:Selendium_serpulae@DN6017_c0_g1_i1.p1